MSMTKIGVIPTYKIEDVNNPYGEFYSVYDNFLNPIYKCGAYPIVILPNKTIYPIELLNECDGFVLCGGRKVEKYYYKIIYYAIKYNKPLLGICLGAQALAIYSLIEDYLNENNFEFNEENFDKAYNFLKENKVMFLTPVENHYKEKISHASVESNKHDIEIKENSILYDIYKTNNIKEVSLHRYAINKYGKNIKITAKYQGVIEGIEYDKENLFIIGTQYHPELSDNMKIFKRLVLEAEKRK